MAAVAAGACGYRVSVFDLNPRPLDLIGPSRLRWLHPHIYEWPTPGSENATDAIEDAAGQVCKGLNGMIEHFNSQRLKLPENEKLYFLPAIFTTGRIWTTGTDLASASLEKGEFDPGSIVVKEVPWLWYQYHLSPALKHTVPLDEIDISPFDLARSLEQESTRSLAIVSVSGIEDFLNHGFPFR